MSVYNYSGYSNKKIILRRVLIIAVFFVSIFFIFRNKLSITNYNLSDDVIIVSPDDRVIHQIHYLLPRYKDGDSFVIVNNNRPLFKSNEISTNNSYESYTGLDDLGRVGVVDVLLNKANMSDDNRSDISKIKPTGWSNIIEQGDRLYNRTYIVGSKLTKNSNNPLNIITGTRFFNNQGLMHIENLLYEYLNNNPEYHVRYRATPLFIGNNLLASGIFVEALSIEDGGESLMFHAFIPNYLPGTTIEYMTGNVMKRSFLDYLKL